MLATTVENGDHSFTLEDCAEGEKKTKNNTNYNNIRKTRVCLLVVVGFSQCRFQTPSWRRSETSLNLCVQQTAVTFCQHLTLPLQPDMIQKQIRVVHVFVGQQVHSSVTLTHGLMIQSRSLNHPCSQFEFQFVLVSCLPPAKLKNKSLGHFTWPNFDVTQLTTVPWMDSAFT